MEDFLNIEFDVVEFDSNEDEFKCSVCGGVLESHKREQSLEEHLMTIYGFVAYHKEKCNQRDEKIFGSFKLVL